MNLDDSVDKHFTRLKPEQKRALHKLGIRTIRDLLYHFPSRYESSGDVGTIAGIAAGAEVTLYGTIRRPDIRKTWKSRRPIAEAWLEDASRTPPLLLDVREPWELDICRIAGSKPARKARLPKVRTWARP